MIVGGKDGVELIRYCIVECRPQLSGECESLTLSASLCAGTANGVVQGSLLGLEIDDATSTSV